MSIAIDNKDDKSNDTILLQCTDGTAVLLRQKFIVAAISPPNAPSTVYVDIGDSSSLWDIEVKENAQDISGPFAYLGNLIFNPAYFLSASDNGDKKDKDQYPWKIFLRTKDLLSFSTTWDPAEIKQAIANIGVPQP
jgi:hypothetical protein